MLISDLQRSIMGEVLREFIQINYSSTLKVMGWTHARWSAFGTLARRFGVDGGSRIGETDIDGNTCPEPPSGSPVPAPGRRRHPPGYRTPSEREEAKERATGRPVGGSAYRARLGPPPQCAPGDHASAREYLGRIEGLLATDPSEGFAQWTRKERTRLKKLRDKWKRRADGRDARFNLVGNRPGGLTPDLQEQVAIGKSIGDLLSSTRTLETKRGKR